MNDRRGASRRRSSVLLVLVVLAGGLMARPALSQEESDAAAVYAEECASCHGVDARGGIGPSLVGSPLTLAEQAALTAAGQDGMPAYGDTLTAGEIEAVLEYAQSLGATEPAAGDDTTAAAIYAESCAGCHGERGFGGPAGPSLVRRSTTVDELVSVITNGQGTMPGFAATYSSAEIEGLAAFVAGFEVPRSLPDEPVAAGAVLYGEGCAGCHGEDASGASAPSLLQTTLQIDELRSVIAAGRGTMPAFGSLGVTNVESLVAYVRAIAIAAGESGAPSTTTSTSTTIGEDPATSATAPPTTSTTVAAAAPEIEPPVRAGRRVFAENCAQCHGVVGEGYTAVQLRGTPLTANEIIARVYGGHTEGMPAFEQALQAAEVEEVALYVLTLPPLARGGAVMWDAVIVAVVVTLALAGAALAAGRWWFGRRRAPADR